MVVNGLTGMQERAEEAGQLLDWAFRETGNYTVATKGAVLADAPVEYGDSKTVPLTVSQDLLLTLPQGDREKVTAKAVVNTPILAPIAPGQEVGKLVVTAPNMPEFTYPLVAAQDVPEIGFGGRISSTSSAWCSASRNRSRNEQGAAGRARFIIFEGGEGAGKSTQVQRLADALRARGEDVVTTREPGGSPGAEAIRGLLVEGDTGALVAGDRGAAASSPRAPIISTAPSGRRSPAGQWVICDRFADSTMAYQGYGMGLDRAWLDELRKRVVGDTEPDLTLVLDLPVEVGLGARASPASATRRMGRAFHEPLRAGFLAIAAADAATLRRDRRRQRASTRWRTEVLAAVAAPMG